MTLPVRCIQVPLMVIDRDGRPPRGPLVVHCFCVCSSSALLGDLVVSKSMECDYHSVDLALDFLECVICIVCY